VLWFNVLRESKPVLHYGIAAVLRGRFAHLLRGNLLQAR